MHWYWSSSGLAVAATAPLFAALTWFAWRQRRASAARSLALMLFAGTWWTLAYSLELSGGDLGTIRVWGDLKYFGVLLVPPAWLLFVLQYTDRERWLRHRAWWLLAPVPLAVVVALTNAELHDLVRFYPPLVPGLGVPSADVGPLFWALVVYSYTLLFWATILLLQGLLRAPAVYRRQAVGVAASWLLVLVGNLLHILEVGPFELLDTTPFALLAMGFVVSWGVLRNGLLPIVPVARDVVIERMSDGVMVLDAYRRVVDMNPAARRALRLRENEGDGAPAADLLPVVPGEDAPPQELTLGAGAGARHYHVVPSPLHDARGRVTGSVLVLRDVTERRHAEERLARMALHDQLTGLANRKLLEDRLAALTAAGRPFTLLFCDLDRFKRINDSLGHDAGDAVLVECARRLQALAGPEDLVARLGGDEFVVVLPGEGDRTTAAAAGRRMIGALGLPVILAGQELWLTCSVGACRAPEQGRQPATLLRRADLAMYRAKTRGGNRVELHADQVEELEPGPLQLERDLHGIARRNELELWYQPITRLADDRCVGMEALLRWRHPLHGLLVPDRFLPVAEQTDLMPALGSWVLGAACEQAARWEPLTRPGPFNISVNLSARQFDPTLVAQVGSVLRTSGLEPSALTLEITETTVLQPGDDTLGVLRGLRGLGVGIATDDFGTGYTSLEQLRHYPLDVLKLDRSFVHGITRRAEDERIVAAMIGLAHDLGLRVVAEGVETSAQRELLRRLDCDAAQGYLYAEPLSSSAAGDYLKAAAPV